MCGIAGIINKSKPAPKEIIQKMCDVMKHRGPDEEGFYIKSNVALGMRRLKVIDISSGSQPIFNEDKSVVVIFNGEIYNYQELRESLIKKGHRFYTYSDTEVIVHLYEEYGESCVNYLNGMFAIALWNEKEKELLLFRDRLGEKPLHYSITDQGIIFSSEIKSMLCNKDVSNELDNEGIYRYFSFYCVPAPLTIYKGIKKLPPGHYLKYKMGKIEIKEYWDFSYRPDFKKTEEEFSVTLHHLLVKSLKKRLISDVPLGAFLSGGIDSSIVVGLMSKILDKPVKTFSIGFDEDRYNELEYARIIAKTFKTEHHEFVVKPSTVNLIEKLLGFFDEPFGGPSAIPTFFVSELAKKYVTVALTGDGGDEIFAGYDSYLTALKREKLKLLPRWFKYFLADKIGNRLPYHLPGKGFLQGLPLDEGEKFCLGVGELWKKDLFSRDFLKKIDKLDSYQIIEKYLLNSFPEYLCKFTYLDTKLLLPNNILVKVDRMSMANSLETRTLFLDHEIVEFAATIPAGLKIKGSITKYILKKSVEDLIPKEILVRGKQGFGLPVDIWFRNKLKDMIISSVEKVKDYGIFNHSFIKNRLDDHLNSKRDNAGFLWSLMAFQKWHEKYFR